MANQIKTAIFAFTSYIRANEQMLVRDLSSTANHEDQEERVVAKQGICDLMEELAERSTTERVTFREFEDLRGKNHDVFIAAPSSLVMDVARAFSLSNSLE